jgi:hypothetical protein
LSVRRLAVLVLILGLGACDGEDPVTRATREVATANHAAAAVEQIKAETAAKAVTPEAVACDVEVSFGSYGTGVDGTLREQIRTLALDDADVITSTDKPWGREGESTLCLRMKDAAATDRLYGMLAAQLPSTSTTAPTTVRHRDGRSRATTYPTGG